MSRELIKITRGDWEKIHRDFKGIWSRPDVPTYVGRRTVLSGCVSDEMDGLLIEGFHFEIV